MRTDDDLLRGEVEIARVVGRVHLAAPREDEVGGQRAATEEHSHFAVRREEEVVGAAGTRAPDLDRLLALRGGPEPQVPLPLQRDALDVRTPGDRHAAVQVAKLGDIDLLRPAVEAGVVDPFAVGRQQLGELVGPARARAL